MPASLADNGIYRGLFGDTEVAPLFAESAEIRAMVLVEGALAKVQGELGLIPQEAADFLHRASFEVQIDPGALSASTAFNGVPIPALLSAFRAAAGASDLTAWLHWGATSQDIVDTALALRLRRVIDIWDRRLGDLLRKLGQLAGDHADLPMAGRTYGQAATPTSFGAVVASWGRPLARYRIRLDALKPDVLKVSLSGAAGTSAAMGVQGVKVRAALAQALDLADPGSSWHSERDGISALAGWMAGVTASLAKMGDDLVLLNHSGIGEVVLRGAGGSSTMPQKQNPVLASALVALGRQVGVLSASLTAAGMHREQRDGAAWFTEWLTLPPACLSTSRALSIAADLADRITPVPDAMARGLEQDHGLVFAEAITFALAQRMPRPDAQEAVKALCSTAASTATDLRDLARRDWPEVDWASVLGAELLGAAPDEARYFSAITNA